MTPDERERLAHLAETQVPRPTAPEMLADTLAERGLTGPEALRLVALVAGPHRALRDLEAQARWQSAFGWFLARSVVVFALLLLLCIAAFPTLIPAASIVAALAGVGGYYVLVILTAPLRLRRQTALRVSLLTRHAAAMQDFSAGLA